MSDRKGVLCVGQVVADVVIKPVDKLPPSGQLQVVSEMQILSGGCACNTACVLAKLGVDVKLTGLVGIDSLSEAIVSEVAAFGVDTSFIEARKDVSISSTAVLIDSHGERCFLAKSGGNELYVGDDIDESILKQLSFVHIGGAMKLLRLDVRRMLSQAKALGCITSIDTDWDPTGQWMKRIESSLPFVDYLITNEIEGFHLTGKSDPVEIGKVILDTGASTVIVKRGAQGCTIVRPDLQLDVPGYCVDVFDTTCAGDSFIAGLICGLSHGLDLVDAARLGNATGALCTTQLSHYGIRTLSDTVAFMKSQGTVVAGI